MLRRKRLGNSVVNFAIFLSTFLVATVPISPDEVEVVGAVSGTGSPKSSWETWELFSAPPAPAPAAASALAAQGQKSSSIAYRSRVITRASASAGAAVCASVSASTAVSARAGTGACVA
eukprot:CAMPEP_0173291670 /NCGR_PEP_ID=MMETSP1143-20121109/12286_1 /TAXON_ID=483371 /ORGANISM="non described non described, Strain CCMP2298" /LENGTH=118 /DNA_ID=CAMNT_0014230941 /DNA_START=74 /DNA_END=431 /DNA_ORIENTATION=+